MSPASGPLWIELLTLFCLSAILAGCSEPISDSETLPARLQQEKTFDSPFKSVDLDGDGTDEQVRVKEIVSRFGGGAVILFSHEGVAIEQVNFPGPVYGAHPRDLEGDGRKELFVPYRKRDSLFVSVLTSTGERIGHFFWTTATPRKVPEGRLGWKPNIAGLFLRDLAGDEAPELVSAMSAHPVPAPRGVWVLGLDGEEIGHYPVGAFLRDVFLADVTGDGTDEMLAATAAVNNGGEAGGFNDRHAYLALFELGPSPHPVWKRTVGGLWAEAYLQPADFGDAPDRVGVVAYRQTEEARGRRKGKLWLFRPDAERPIAQSLTVDRLIQDVAATDLNRDGIDEVLLLDDQGTVLVFDENLEVLDRRFLRRGVQKLETLPDVSGDGVEELVAQTSSGTLFLGPNFGIRAASEHTDWDVLRRGTGRRPHLVTSSKGKGLVYAWQSNRWWWLYRYGPWGGGVLALLLIGVLGVVWWRRAVRRRKTRQLGTHLWNEHGEGLLLYHPDEETVEWNEGATTLLGGVGSDGSVDRSDLKTEVPSLSQWLEALPEASEDRHRKEMVLNGHPLAVRAEPLELRKRGKPYWLVALGDRTQQEGQYEAWALMARRVAHDLKNPLTTILLSLQRMQMEYRERAPELAADLDEYADRMEDRIESLRRKATNLLKFMDLEAPSRTTVALNDFVREVLQKLRQGIPPDIELNLEFVEEGPTVQVDREQMRSVLENLVENAIEAMEEGGRLTVRTDVLDDLQFDPEQAPRTYGLIEVLDTGTGMPPEIQARLFEPGYGTTEEGTGIGLAIVKKIVEDHGGQVEVDTEEGVGTGVAIYLPAGS